MVSLPDYAELHCLSNFTFLRGASHPEELVAQAVAQGYTALALTDECSLAGVVRAHLATREAGLKLIVGSEISIPQGDLSPRPRSLAGAVDGLKLVFLACNREGYGNLSALITLARRRAEKGAYALQRHDLNVVSPSGAVPDCLVLWVPGDSPSAADGRWLAEHFSGRAWIAVELHAGPDDAARLEALQALGAASGLPLVAAGDVHMHIKARRPVQDVLTALRLKTTVFDAGY
ncbi:MAG: PHP domain-containing protein, partial [Candidatus Dechloromonas phosphoritropha]